MLAKVNSFLLTFFLLVKKIRIFVLWLCFVQQTKRGRDWWGQSRIYGASGYIDWWHHQMQRFVFLERFGRKDGFCDLQAKVNCLLGFSLKSVMMMDDTRTHISIYCLCKHTILGFIKPTKCMLAYNNDNNVTLNLKGLEIYIMHKTISPNLTNLLY